MKAGRARGRRAERRGQGGFGLLESIVSIALVSTVILALAAGLLTSVKSSQSAKETQELDAALSAYAESFKNPSLYASLIDPCSSASYTGLPVTTPPGTSSASVVSGGVKHWDPTAADPWVGTCSTDPGVHRLTVQVTMAASGASGTAQVVMRKP